MLSRILFEDPSLRLRVNWLGAGALYVDRTIGGETRSRRSHAFQKSYFLAVTKALEGLGVRIAPDDPVCVAFFRSFALALEDSPASLTWRVILSRPPEQMAQEFFDASKVPPPVPPMRLRRE